MENEKTKFLTYTSIGVGLYVVVSLILNIRLIGNYSLHLGYMVLFIYTYCFSVSYGLIVGGLGVLIYGVVSGATGSLIGWFFSNIILVILLSGLFYLTKRINNRVVVHLLIIFGIALIAFISFLLVKPIVETLLSGIDFSIRFLANVPGFILNTIVLIPTYPVAIRINKIIKK